MVWLGYGKLELPQWRSALMKNYPHMKECPIRETLPWSSTPMKEYSYENETEAAVEEDMKWELSENE